jgi:hypothetical protein
MSAGFTGFVSQVQDVSVREMMSKPADFSVSPMSCISIFTVNLTRLLGRKHENSYKSEEKSSMKMDPVT